MKTLTKEEINKRLLSNLSNYSENQKLLANYILKNMQTVPLLSVNEIAEKVGVSNATVVRFAKLLKFKGYMDFRNNLKNCLEQDLSPIEKYKVSLSKEYEHQDNFNKIAKQIVKQINYSIQQNTLNDIKEVANLINKSENIYCIGMGLSYYISCTLAYMLRLYMKNAQPLLQDSLSLPEQIVLNVKKDDLIITFNFPPYSLPTVEAAKFAQNQGISVISFTDSQTAPIAQYSDSVLIAKTDKIPFTNSLGSIFVLLNSVVTEITEIDTKKASKGLKKIEKFINDKKYYI